MELAKSRRSRVWNPQLVCGMESTRSVECNQSEGGYTLTRDAMPSLCDGFHTPCGWLHANPKDWTFGLDRKKTVRKRSFFLAPPAGLEPATTWLTVRCSTDWAKEEYSRWPIFPGRRQPSIVGITELNFCVRNGYRWTLCDRNTNFFIFVLVCFDPNHKGF